MKAFYATTLSLSLAAGLWASTPQSVETAQSTQFSNQCITPFSFCFLAAPLPVGTPCICPDGQGGLVQF